MHSVYCDVGKPPHVEEVNRLIRVTSVKLYPELLDELGHPPVEPNAHRSRSISDVSSFSTLSVLSFCYHPCEGAVCLRAPARMD